MAILKLQEAVDARVAIDIDPCETKINEHLKTQRVVDYVTNPEIANPNLQVNIDGVTLTNAAREALKASVEAAEWKSVEVKQGTKGVVVTFSKEEKTPPAEPDVYVATATVDKASLKPGETAQISVTVTKNGEPFAEAKPTYVSGNPPFATVDATGKVTAVAIGQTVVTVAEGELYSTTVTVDVVAGE